MTIILAKEGLATAEILDRSPFDKERNLQEFIHQHPETIPVYEIQEDKRLFVAAREFSTGSGPIDALALDHDGDIYIVETKLYRNSDKRTIVAQALDYGASLWKHFGDFSEFVNALESAAQEAWHVGFEQKLKLVFSIDDEQLNLLFERMRINLREGNLKFVILMDSIEERLKDLLTYVNQNSQFDIYAVQVDYYRHQDYEIVIPRLFGAEVKKNQSVSPTVRNRWTERSVFEEAKSRLTPEEYSSFEKIYRFAKSAGEVRFGSGSYASFSAVFPSICAKSLFTLGTDKRLSFNFEWIVRDSPQAAEKYKAAMEGIGFHFSDDFRTTRPSVPAPDWVPKVDDLISAITKLL